MKKVFSVLLFCFFVLLAFYSCRKEDIFNEDSDAKLNFSDDLICFDTVFTTITTATRQLMVYNPYSESIKISSIYLAGLQQSYFSINVNGKSGVSFTDVEIRPKDSLYIFIQAKINPNNQNNPLLISDSIVFNTNGNVQDIDLLAYGQDANFIIADTYRTGLPPYKIVAGEGQTVNWNNSKPYVIYGYAVIDSVGSLKIPAGTQIYLHKNAGIWVYKGGNIQVNGTKDLPVVFQGDRRETWYTDAPGQWDRIWINEGANDNIISHAIIKNSFIGIQAETLDASMGNKLILENTRILNASGIGLLSRNYKIDATNNLIANCGQYCVALTYGGTYQFIHNTFANFWTETVRQTPLFYMNNFLETSTQTYINDLQITVANSIIYGSNINEFEMEKKPNTVYNYLFDHCIIRTDLNISSDAGFVECKKNVNPSFIDQSVANYNIPSTSPAIDAGSEVYLPIVGFDINENPRSSPPDIGAFEYTPSGNKNR